MTGRGWWVLAYAVAMLLVGVLRDVSLLTIPALTLLLWFAWEWVLFAVRVRLILPRLRLEREVGDERGPLETLWAGRDYEVRVRVDLDGPAGLPFVAIRDVVPFALSHEDGPTVGRGRIGRKDPIAFSYVVSCPRAGRARFEGVRVEMTDLQGFFARVTFLRVVANYPVLPAVVASRGGGPLLKHHNELPPPGIHRLRQPGSASELLDLRDYIPGDPPRTIAWKVSARRDRLVTKVFESEVPVRATVFLDTSSSVRIPSPVYEPGKRKPRKADTPVYLRPLDRLIELTAGILRVNAGLRDLTGLCTFDETSSQIVRPERTSHHAQRLLRVLADAASLGPVASRGDPAVLMPLAMGLAQEVYPDLLRPEVNALPAWVIWFGGFPGATRHKRGWLDRLHRAKRRVLFVGSVVVPVGLSLLNFAALVIDGVPDLLRGLILFLWLVVSPLSVGLSYLLFFSSVTVSYRQRNAARWRKRLAALFCVRATAAPGGAPTLPIEGGTAALMEDDDLFSLHLHHFLAEHQVPCAVPLYDERGRYLFAVPEKVSVLAAALMRSVARGRDNELFVLMADLLELDGHLEPLFQAVRVALARHHQVLLVCPWPEDVPTPDDKPRRGPEDDTLQGLLREATVGRFHAAFGRLRQAFARLGVQMVCATDGDTVSLVVRRLEQIRMARISAHPGSRGGRR